ncbi:LysE family transporter [Gammaproteobacteria bacterium AS21]
MNIEQSLIIAAITWLAVISPGADFAIVSRNSYQYGKSAGLYSAAGIASGCWLHVLYASLGLTLIINYIPNFLVIMQYLGAAYLIYLGVSTIYSQALQETSHTLKHISHWQHFRTGLLTNSLNPKTSIFVISLYSQVIATTPSLQQWLWGTFISLSHFVWFAAIALFMSAKEIRHWILQRQRSFNLIIGALLSVLGILLLSADLLL